MTARYHGQWESGEMSRQQLRIELEWFCGCGNPEDAAQTLRTILALHPLYENGVAFRTIFPDTGLRYLVLYHLSDLELTEHGGTVGGGWLTDKGKAMLAGLDRESADEFEGLFESHCVHGFDSGDVSHDCMAVCEAERRAGLRGI